MPISKKAYEGYACILSEGHDLILLCQCPTYASCHRKVLVDQLTERTSIEVIQLGVMEKSSETIMALSIQQPYAQWLANPGQFVNANILPKIFENRTWTTRYRGPLLFMPVPPSIMMRLMSGWVGVRN